MSENKQTGDFRDTLYTVDKQGKRRWVYPEIVKGRWFYRRAVVAYALIAFYLSMPWVSIGGKQGIRIDLPGRKFIFFGQEFWATDTHFLFLLLGTAAFSLFLFTALVGRVWCGWACPETVFLEFVFRPIERLVEGNASQRKRLDQSPWTFNKIWRKSVKHFLCAAISWVIASSALAYFVGREPLINMMSNWPHHNPVPFTVTCILMGLMAFQFGWFREQFCTILCPYARFQSVLMDQNSIVVGYDIVRGEPRGKVKKSAENEAKGHCVDCGLCVRVCPTGIDIRNGLQLECVACTSCVDACDSIMNKLGLPEGLIRYDTENRLLGRSLVRGILRPRPFLYFALVSTFVSGLIYSWVNHQPAEFQVLRKRGPLPFSTLGDGKISNQLEIHATNKSDYPISIKFSVDGADEVSFVTPENPLTIDPQSIKVTPAFAVFPESLLKGGSASISIKGEAKDGFVSIQKYSLIGPG